MTAQPTYDDLVATIVRQHERIQELEAQLVALRPADPSSEPIAFAKRLIARTPE